MNQTSFKKLYPSTKFLLALLISLAALLVDHLYFSLICLVFIIFVYIVLGEKKLLLQNFKRLAILVFFMIIMRAMFTPGEHFLFKIGSIKIYQEGMRLGLIMATNVSIFVLSLILVFELTSTKDIVAALENTGFSPSAAFMILSAFNMIPEMKKRSTVIMEAQSCRGVETEGNLWIRTKAFLPMLGPLILSSIANAEERVITLEARGFSAQTPKTRLYHLKKTTLDKRLFLLICCLGILLLGWKVMQWLK